MKRNMWFEEINLYFWVVWWSQTTVLARWIARVRTINLLEWIPIIKPISNCLCNFLQNSMVLENRKEINLLL
jgi:hypothetical protein